MPNTDPSPRVPHRRNGRTVRTTSLRALAVAAHLERGRTAPVRHGPDPDGDQGRNRGGRAITACRGDDTERARTR